MDGKKEMEREREVVGARTKETLRNEINRRIKNIWACFEISRVKSRNVAYRIINQDHFVQR
jgi:two-component sensor histidine kinase